MHKPLNIKAMKKFFETLFFLLHFVFLFGFIALLWNLDPKDGSPQNLPRAYASLIGIFLTAAIILFLKLKFKFNYNPPGYKE